eukprot:5132068-Pleurochrysis_carterae.AAC.1
MSRLSIRTLVERPGSMRQGTASAEHRNARRAFGCYRARSRAGRAAWMRYWAHPLYPPVNAVAVRRERGQCQ